MSSLLIKNGVVINPAGAFGKFNIFIEDGIIACMDEETGENADRVIDAEGLFVAPGFIDMHCHLREPGFEYKEDIASGTAAAAKGGFTTIACMPNTSPPADDASVIKAILASAKKANGVRVLPIGCTTKGQEGAELAMQYAQSFDALIISHCEDTDLVNGGVMNEGEMSCALGLRGTTPLAEEMHIAREILFAEHLKTRVHIAHVSTAVGVGLIRDAKARGVNVSCETAPHYIYSTDELVDGFNTLARVNPPLRTDKDREALIKGLMEGVIDCIATDHAPHHMDEKNVEFELAASGIAGFETAFSIAYTVLCKQNGLPLEELVGLMSIAPAEILGLRMGIIEEGSPADITIFDVEEHVVESEKWLSRGRNNPYIGEKFFGGVAYTIVDGNIIYERKCDN